MPEYLTPGVYVEELPSPQKPIEGVDTSITGFVGLSLDIPDKKMPKKSEGNFFSQAGALEPTLLNNWEQFKQKFGDFQEANEFLAQAVYGFFNNGGTRCWVTRVTDVSDVRKAINKFNVIDGISIIAAPLPPETPQNILNNVHLDLLRHCQHMRYRIAILDCSRDIINDNLVIATDETGIWLPEGNNIGYGIFYFPWIEVVDRKPGATADGSIMVPPSGHLAGVYARNDALRGVHKAPANESIIGALGVRYPVDHHLQQIFNVRGVNCIRSFNGAIKAWGARTLSTTDGTGDSKLKYIHVRRLLNFLEKSIENGTRWVVFEPNTPVLWTMIIQHISSFLINIWRTGALSGDIPGEAFYVKCDKETNPSSNRNLNEVIIEIGVAVLKPAEFIVFRISRHAAEK